MGVCVFVGGLGSDSEPVGGGSGLGPPSHPWAPGNSENSSRGWRAGSPLLTSRLEAGCSRCWHRSPPAEKLSWSSQLLWPRSDSLTVRRKPRQLGHPASHGGHRAELIHFSRRGTLLRDMPSFIWHFWQWDRRFSVVKVSLFRLEVDTYMNMLRNTQAFVTFKKWEIFFKGAEINLDSPLPHSLPPKLHSLLGVDMSGINRGLLFAFGVLLCVSAEQQQGQSGFRRLYVVQPGPGPGSAGGDGGVRVSSISTRHGAAGKPRTYNVELNANFGGQVRTRRMGNQAAPVPQFSPQLPSVVRQSGQEQSQQRQVLKLPG